MFLLPEELEYVRPANQMDEVDNEMRAGDAMKTGNAARDDVVWRTLRLAAFCAVPLMALTFYFSRTPTFAIVVVLPACASCIWAIVVVKAGWLMRITRQWVQRRFGRAANAPLRWRKTPAAA
ncbi:MAG: hypothetical protein MJA84_01530 [Firmicutes bacterium]|nr:hypothetical protein [Bacillota bacterium]